MEYRPVGQTSLIFSCIGFGAWALGGPSWQYGWGPQDEQQSIRAIHRAIDLGINWIDTAPAYGLGLSEEIIGKALVTHRGKMLTATKCGLRWNEAHQLYEALDAPGIRHEVEASLRRLRVDTIDLYQIHWPSPRAQLPEAWETLAALTREGKIRYAALCNASEKQLTVLHANHPVAALQVPYSLVNRYVETRLQGCAARDISILAYSPLQNGLLTGAFTIARRNALPGNDWRRKDRHFLSPQFERILALVNGLIPLVQERGWTVGQLALAWVLRRREVTAAIVGARSEQQIEETAIASSFSWDEALEKRVSTLLLEVFPPRNT